MTRKRRVSKTALSDLIDLVDAINNLFITIGVRLQQCEQHKFVGDSTNKTVHGFKSDSTDYSSQRKIKSNSVVDSAYRFMDLKPGCGAEMVRKAFRRKVREIRPDLVSNDKKENELKENQFIALQTARDVLLEIEK